MFISLFLSTDLTLKKWHEFMLLSDRKPKPKENAKSSYGRVKAIIKYFMLAWEEAGRGAFYHWLFLNNPEHLKL